MRALIERVSSAKVEVDGQAISAINIGLLVYLGVAEDDEPSDADYVADKIRYLRIFEDDAGKMNLDVMQIAGQVLVVPAFTLQADARKGRRPSFDNAAKPEKANELYQLLIDKLKARQLSVQTGKFAYHMHITAINDGPICILMDTQPI